MASTLKPVDLRWFCCNINPISTSRSTFQKHPPKNQGQMKIFSPQLGLKRAEPAPVTLPDEFIISGNLTLWIIWIIQHQLGSRDIFTFPFNLVKSFGWQALWIFQRISGKSKVSSFGLRARYEIFTGGKRPRRNNKRKQKKLSFFLVKQHQLD